jgi:hypothetical protein
LEKIALTIPAGDLGLEMTRFPVARGDAGGRLTVSANS